MCWRRLTALLLLTGNAAAADGYIIGFGLEGDSADGLAASVIGDIALAENTWLSAAIARTTVNPPIIESLDTWYGDVGLDHWFDPMGVRLGVAYWGDSDILDSVDLRGSLYWRKDRVTLAGDYEFRDFSLEFPTSGNFGGRSVDFNATGIGLTTRFQLTDKTSLGINGMNYDYSVGLGVDQNRGILELLSSSRLSLISSLVDYRARVSLDHDAGEQRWQLELATWKSEVDGGTTRSATIRLMTPMGESSDIEFGLGLDDSDLYGNVTFLSVFLYFYGD